MIKENLISREPLNAPAQKLYEIKPILILSK